MEMTEPRETPRVIRLKYSWADKNIKKMKSTELGFDDKNEEGVNAGWQSCDLGRSVHDVTHQNKEP